MKNFSWYEQTGILIPGASFVLGLIAPFPKNEKRSQNFTVASSFVPSL
jgi:hypothetical protein